MNARNSAQTKDDSLIYIRPLRVEDAKTSFEWRNDKRIWRYTGSKPDKYITYEIELAWIEDVLKRENEQRFAICLSGSDRYIGNVFLTGITPTEAHVHIFIGDIKFWGKGRANQAVRLVCELGFQDLRLEVIYAEINKRNNASLLVALAEGFSEVDEYYDDQRKITIVKLALTSGSYSK